MTSKTNIEVPSLNKDSPSITVDNLFETPNCF